jgi:hypothetical protein
MARQCRMCGRGDESTSGPWTIWPILGGEVCGHCRTDAYEAAEFERNVTPLVADLRRVDG